MSESTASLTLVAVDQLDGRPVILVSDPDQIPDIQANYPRAAVVSLPEDCELWSAVESWPLYLCLFQQDVTLWAETQRDAALLRAICPVLDVAGVRTCRWAVVASGVLEGTQAVWKDRAPLR